MKTKTKVTLSIDSDIYNEFRSRFDFNLSKGLENTLRKLNERSK